jgi:hypothetical protein
MKNYFLLSSFDVECLVATSIEDSTHTDIWEQGAKLANEVVTHITTKVFSAIERLR